MRKGLFRQQVSENQRPRLHGELLMTPSPMFSLVTCFLLVWTLSAVVFLTTSNYSRKASISGWLEPDRGIIRLYSPLPQGRISKLFVSEGSLVDKGQPLIEIDFSTRLHSDRSVESELSQALIATKTRLQQSLVRAQLIHKSDYEQRVNERLVAEADLASLIDIQHLAHQQWELASKAHLAQRLLYVQGNISQKELDAAALYDLSTKQQFKEARRNVEQKRAHILELTQTIATLPDAQANEQVALENQISDIEKQLLQINKSGTRVIYATSSSIVSTIQGVVGHTVDASKPLISLLPQDANIQARLLLPVRAAGFVSSGQQITIRYDAFPYQKFGLHQGSIQSVSQTLILPGEIANAPIQVTEPTYLVRATLNENVIRAYGKTIALKTGMTFTADISLGDRTLFEWLLEPILSTTGRL